jgi:ABC-type lipopolysaccharide export system ATPase subunit
VGEIVGLLGRNGCGKSTLLKVINRTLNPGDSYVRVGDKVILSSKDAMGQIAYLAQETFLPRGEKVKTLLKCYLEQDEYEKLSTSAFLSPIWDTKAQYLSGGETRLLEVLMLLNCPAPFILLDEPFSSLAPLYVEQLQELITQRSKTKGILITDHNYKNVLNICTRTIVLVDGKTNEVAEPDDLYHFGYLPKGASLK